MKSKPEKENVMLQSEVAELRLQVMQLKRVCAMKQQIIEDLERQNRALEAGRDNAMSLVYALRETEDKDD